MSPDPWQCMSVNLARHHACLHNSTCWDYFCLGPSIRLIQKIELRTIQSILGSGSIWYHDLVACSPDFGTLAVNARRNEISGSSNFRNNKLKWMGKWYSIGQKGFRWIHQKSYSLFSRYCIMQKVTNYIFFWIDIKICSHLHHLNYILNTK